MSRTDLITKYSAGPHPNSFEVSKVSKVKVVPYTFMCRGVPVREDTYAGLSACDVGWPVPFLAAFISPMFLLGTHLLLGER